MTENTLSDLQQQRTWYEETIRAVENQRPRAFMGANGLYYAAVEDDDGFHAQGVGRHETAAAALRAYNRGRTEHLHGLRDDLCLIALELNLGRMPTYDERVQALKALHRDDAR
jgi:hypothetical protein